MERPTKKQKTSGSDGPSTFVFDLPGFQPDTSLKVFDVDFHVHSNLLKIHSAFFRKFLDSPDKVATTPLSSKFKYNWITKLDKDAEGGEENSWSLVADVQSPKVPVDLSTYKGNKKHQQNSFETLLCAFYNRPYKLGRLRDLETLTTLGDYYRALPLISYSLNSALRDSHDFNKAILYEPRRVFELAFKLRNRFLFRDALVCVVNPHNDPRFTKLKDSRLRMIARCAHGEIAAKVGRAMSDVVLWQQVSSDTDEEVRRCKPLIEAALTDLRSDWLSDGNPVHYPAYFRAIIKAYQGHPEIEDYFSLGEVLSNNLVLFGQNFEAGDVDNRDFEDHFFCAQIADEDLPWDLEETDW